MVQGGNPDQEQGPALSLPNLLLMFGFVAPPAALGASIKAAGGGALRYSIGISLGLMAGAIIVYLNWNLWRYLLVRSKTVSARARNSIFLCIFGLHVGWIIVGFMAGFALSRAVIRSVP
jgi:heme/copper-type cytochrome/quinol oxidase subunit 3